MTRAEPVHLPRLEPQLKRELLVTITVHASVWRLRQVDQCGDNLKLPPQWSAALPLGTQTDARPVQNPCKSGAATSD
jgi:hypothetical protein